MDFNKQIEDYKALQRERFNKMKNDNVDGNIIVNDDETMKTETKTKTKINPTNITKDDAEIMKHHENLNREEDIKKAEETIQYYEKLHANGINKKDDYCSNYYQYSDEEYVYSDEENNTEQHKPIDREKIEMEEALKAIEEMEALDAIKMHEQLENSISTIEFTAKADSQLSSSSSSMN
jgi:hypothetical protein